MKSILGMDLRVLSERRRFTEVAVIEPRTGRAPLRTEVVRNNKLNSHFCRACKIGDAETGSECRHIKAARRFLARTALSLVAAPPAPNGDQK